MWKLSINSKLLSLNFKTKKQAMKALKENVDDWNNDPNTTERYSYNDYRVIYTDKNNNKFLVLQILFFVKNYLKPYIFFVSVLQIYVF